MRMVWIVNPVAGAVGKEQRLRRAIEALPRREENEILVTAGPGDATRAVRRWGEEHPGVPVRFVACGGDGTLHEVVNGAVGLENASVTVYPCGSGNDFVKTFGGAERFLDLQALTQAPGRKIDLLQVGDRYSVNVINFGFDAQVARMVNESRDRKGYGAKSAYTKGVVRALARYMRNEFTVTADGEVLNPEGRGLLCTLGNAQYVGGSYRCAPRARLDDGLMEVCLVRPVSRLRFVRLAGTYARGEHLEDPRLRDKLVYRRARKVEVTGPKGFILCLDGEIVERERFTVEVKPQCLELAVPGSDQ